ncbi:tagaturonate reductase [Muricauda sp. ANG21]|uniref:tagaturonate reductase n=1 Tax=Allomuricauda sp. ANG21 TaxID=3042468 RepID=UPI003455F72A
MKLNRNTVPVSDKQPIKVIQFGEGNFLRAFVEYAFQRLNDEIAFNAGIAVIQPLSEGLINKLNDQDGLYTLFLKGIKDGKTVQEKHLISNIVKGVDPHVNFDVYCDLAKELGLQFIISNTTEAGIAFNDSDTFDMQPPSSFPGKLTRLLYERFQYFNGDHSKGLTIIPCELINYNADTLKHIILQYVVKWELGEVFKTWLLEANTFHNTLVDRIVPGYPKDTIEQYNAQLGYEDRMLVTAENFFLWVIEGGSELKKKLPFSNIDLDVKIVDDMQPYRTRKVRILNGAHTVMVPLSLLYGNETVKETMDDPFTGAFVREAVFGEIIPTLEMDRDELENFAIDIFDRFRNPFIKHLLSSIALNSVSKFKVRVLPSLLTYIENTGQLPKRLVFALACLIRFYKGEWNGAQLPVRDDKQEMASFIEAWNMTSIEGTVSKILGNIDFWGTDLTQVEKLEQAVIMALEEMEANGIEVGFKNYSSKLIA